MSEAFFEAVAAGDVEAVRAALDADASLVSATTPARFDQQGGPGALPLHLAAFHGRLEVERLLVERGADPGALSDEGRTALHVALECNNTTTDDLIGLGCPVDVWAAAALGDLERLDALIAEDPSCANDDRGGLDPLGWAAYFGNEGSTERLLAAGADPTRGALLCAAQVGCVPVAKLLVAAGADPAHVHEGFDGNALHAAALMLYTSDARPFVDWLLEIGVDPAIPAGNGMTARQLAERTAQGYEAARAERPELGEKPYAEIVATLAAAEARGSGEPG